MIPRKIPWCFAVAWLQMVVLCMCSVAKASPFGSIQQQDTAVHRSGGGMPSRLRRQKHNDNSHSSFRSDFLFGLGAFGVCLAILLVMMVASSTRESNQHANGDAEASPSSTTTPAKSVPSGVRNSFMAQSGRNGRRRGSKRPSQALVSDSALASVGALRPQQRPDLATSAPRGRGRVAHSTLLHHPLHELPPPVLPGDTRRVKGGGGQQTLCQRCCCCLFSTGRRGQRPLRAQPTNLRLVPVGPSSPVQSTGGGAGGGADIEIRTQRSGSVFENTPTNALAGALHRASLVPVQMEQQRAHGSIGSRAGDRSKRVSRAAGKGVQGGAKQPPPDSMISTTSTINPAQMASVEPCDNAGNSASPSPSDGSTMSESVADPCESDALGTPRVSLGTQSARTRGSGSMQSASGSGEPPLPRGDSVTATASTPRTSAPPPPKVAKRASAPPSAPKQATTSSEPGASPDNSATSAPAATSAVGTGPDQAAPNADPPPPAKTNKPPGPPAKRPGRFKTAPPPGVPKRFVPPPASPKRVSHAAEGVSASPAGAAAAPPPKPAQGWAVADMPAYIPMRRTTAAAVREAVPSGESVRNTRAVAVARPKGTYDVSHALDDGNPSSQASYFSSLVAGDSGPGAGESSDYRPRYASVIHQKAKRFV